MSRITMKRWSGGWYSYTWVMELPKNSMDNGTFVVSAAKDDEQQHLTIEVVEAQRKWDRFGERIIPEDTLGWFGTRTFEEPNTLKAQVIPVSDSEGYIDRSAVEAHIRAVVTEWERTHGGQEPEYCPSVRWTEEQRREARYSIPSYERRVDGE